MYCMHTCHESPSVAHAQSAGYAYMSKCCRCLFSKVFQHVWSVSRHALIASISVRCGYDEVK